MCAVTREFNPADLHTLFCSWRVFVATLERREEGKLNPEDGRLLFVFVFVFLKTQCLNSQRAKIPEYVCTDAVHLHLFALNAGRGMTCQHWAHSLSVMLCGCLFARGMLSSARKIVSWAVGKGQTAVNKDSEEGYREIDAPMLCYKSHEATLPCCVFPGKTHGLSLLSPITHTIYERSCIPRPNLHILYICRFIQWQNQLTKQSRHVDHVK